MGEKKTMDGSFGGILDHVGNSSTAPLCWPIVQSYHADWDCDGIFCDMDDSN